MRTFTIARLVRDRIVEQIIKAGNVPHWRVLSGEQYWQALKDKLVEEAQEMQGASGEDLIDELADVQEVVDSLLKMLDLTKEQLSETQQKKNKKNGPFEKRDYIDEVEVKDDSEWVHYYLKKPEKFPERS